MKEKLKKSSYLKQLALMSFVAVIANASLPNALIIVKADSNQALPNHIIVNQVYGAGPAPDSSVPVSNSFIELYNPTSSAVNLAGYSLWYRHGNDYTNAALKDGTALSPDKNWYELNLTGTIPAHGSYLVKGASALVTESSDPANIKASVSATTSIASTVHLYFKDSDVDTSATATSNNSNLNNTYSAIPTVTADQSWNVRFANKGVEVLLLDSSAKNIYTPGTTGTGATSSMPINPFNTDGKGKKVTGYVDMIGVSGNDSYDNTIDGYESSFTSVQSKQKALRRINFQDTDKNSDDFEIVPYNAAYIVPWAKPHSSADGAWNPSVKPLQPDDTAFGATVPTDNPPAKSTVTAVEPQILTNTSSAVTSVNAQFSSNPNAPYNLTNNFTADPTSTRTFTWNAPISVTNGQVQISTNNATVSSVKASGATKYTNTVDYSSFTAGVVSSLQTTVSYSIQKLYDAPLNAININNYSVFRAKTSGLQPGTTYYYRVGNSTDGWSPVYSFTTESTNIAKGTDAFTFLHVSDTQATTLGDYQTWQTAIDSYLPSLSQPVSFFLHTGDECDGTNREDEWRGFFGTPTYDATGKIASGDYRYHFGNYAFMPVVGNHEQAGPTDAGNAGAFTEHFTVPNNGPTADSVTQGTVYSFDYGTAHFIVLNTQTDLSSQAQWLAKDLAATDKKWKIVALHRGLYESPGQDDTLINTFGSIFDKYGVDLILQGHDHVYVKSKPMRAGQVDPNGIGTISLETGSSGAKQDSAGGLLNYEEINVTNGAPAFSAITVSNSGISVDTKKVVTNADKSVTLTKVNTFSITAPETQKIADIVTAQIAALPSNIKLENAAAVTAARTAYNNLSTVEQGLVTNYNVLTAAENTIAQLQAASTKAQQDQAAEGIINDLQSIPSNISNNDTNSIVKDIVNAIKYGVATPVIDISGNSVISKDIFNEIKGYDKAITFTGSNISWTFNGKDISASVTADIDLSLKTVSADLKAKEAAKIKAVIGKDANITPFSYKYEGQLPGNATIKVLIGKDWTEKTVNVCKYYSDKNTYEVIQSNVKVDADGYVTYTANHCSDYFVVDTAVASNLPQTGTMMDSSMIIIIGIFIIIAGGTLLFNRRKETV